MVDNKLFLNTLWAQNFRLCLDNTLGHSIFTRQFFRKGNTEAFLLIIKQGFYAVPLSERTQKNKKISWQN
jgi:hypothetical protein